MATPTRGSSATPFMRTRDQVIVNPVVATASAIMGAGIVIMVSQLAVQVLHGSWMNLTYEHGRMAMQAPRTAQSQDASPLVLSYELKFMYQCFMSA